MHYQPALIPGTLLRRYKRFLADIVYKNGQQTTVHCANPGSMLGLAAPGNPVWVSDSQNPKRKLRMSLELIEVDGVLVGINTHLANKLAEEAIKSGQIPELAGYDSHQREVKYGQNSRIDFLLQATHRRKCFVEVKSVTLSRRQGVAEFPDSITSRGSKHLGELSAQVKAGNRAVQLFVVQRADCQVFTPAADIDPQYAKTLADAIAAGVEVLAVTCQISSKASVIATAIPVELS
ncbi:Sugar fermentation stimulation protein SfsA [hydrothermal vent metagenome]|uniref:Sugar fermentation stimulation protein SfsA n=1 Tax=hydrothermal vent metagenome TaxID=652676 RepID=A0A3B0S9I0_9ZZZZ